MGKESRLLVVSIAVLSLGACTTTPVDPVLASSATYQTGYNDGCKTARERAQMFDRTVVRDDAAYAKDENYKRGWNKGYRDCGSQATQADPYSEPLPQWQKRGGPLGN